MPRTRAPARRALAHLLLTLLAPSAALAPPSTAQADSPPAGYSIPIVDLADDAGRVVEVDREPGVYLGHPTTVLLEDGRTILCVYPRGHGKGPILMKRSEDGGRTWGERLPTPENWATSQETPTIHRVVDAEGTRRLIVWSGLYPARLAVSEDDGASWSPLEPVGDWGGIVVMGSVVGDGPGVYRAFFHDDGRFLREGGVDRGFHVYQSVSRDGGLTWGQPEHVTTHPTAHLCEPGLVRSPDGTRLAALLRENSRRHNSFVIFSEDGGATWSAPRELPGALTGDRHVARYAPDGRLFISFRDTTRDSPTQGDWVGWVGTWDDIVQGREGQYRVRLMDNHHRWDCAYPAVELLPDGTFVATTYGHWTEGEPPWIASLRFTLDELDERLAAQHAARADRAADPRPNVLLLVADDQGWADLGAAGLAPDVETPALDALAAGGVRFTTAYSASPICNPARAALMTGCDTQRYGVRWYGGPGLPAEGFPTLAELLREAGYATGYVGKVHYGGRAQHRPGRRSFPLEHGFDEYYGFSEGRKHYLVHSDAEEAVFSERRAEHGRKGQSLEMGSFWEGEARVEQQGFSTELLGARARAFLDEHRDEPFFLTVSFNAVHNFTHQLPEAELARQGLEPYPDWDPAVEPYDDWYVRGRKPNNPDGRAHFLGQLRLLDTEVGRLLGHLDELGLGEDTLVLYIGDNGGSTPIYADNGPLRGGKYTLYEGGVRVPLLARWPGRWREGAVVEAVVSALDLLPTVCVAAGLPAPPHVDGADLGPLLRGESDAPTHETLFWDTGHERAVRHGRWKLHEALSDGHAVYEMTELELGTHLVDLEADPGERADIAAEQPERVEELRRLWQAWDARVRGN